MSNVWLENSLLQIWNQISQNLFFISQVQAFEMRALQIFVVLLFAILVEPQDSFICEENEKFTDCQTCETKCGGNIYECVPKCVPGCTCDQKYARDPKTGKCIKHSDCRKQVFFNLDFKVWSLNFQLAVKMKALTVVPLIVTEDVRILTVKYHAPGYAKLDVNAFLVMLRMKSGIV